MKEFTFNKEEKLKSRKLIEHLFSKGKSVYVFPVKALYSFIEGAPIPLQAGVTTSSRVFKKAVQRNRVKRVLREAYRLQKPTLQQVLNKSGRSVIIFFIYVGKELPVFSEVHDKMGVVLQKITDSIKQIIEP